MKVIKLVYDFSCTYVLSILENLEDKIILESYNIDYHKDKKSAISLMTRYGTKKVPLLVFEDENLEEYAAHWAESNEEITAELINNYIKNK